MCNCCILFISQFIHFFVCSFPFSVLPSGGPFLLNIVFGCPLGNIPLVIKMNRRDAIARD